MVREFPGIQRVSRREIRGLVEDIPLPAKIDTSYTNPKRKRGKNLSTSLALRVSVVSGRERYNWIARPRILRLTQLGPPETMIS